MTWIGPGLVQNQKFGIVPCLLPGNPGPSSGVRNLWEPLPNSSIWLYSSPEAIRLGNRFGVLGKMNKNPSNNSEPPADPAPASLKLLSSGPVGASATGWEQMDTAHCFGPLLWPTSSRGRSPVLPGDPQPQPTPLVMGDSIIQNIRSGSAITCRFPRATVRNIASTATEVIATRPGVSVGGWCCTPGCHQPGQLQPVLVQVNKSPHSCQLPLISPTTIDVPQVLAPARLDSLFL
ncbi:Hypothetical predicted protein [Xyrichtys novacula]|uniref:Uncharacterized protein n=1 Tax=Xyrichtys novacula TaxID=13765 RepID=A0AAV1H550_XYRNO|nr:Hypothetical predicted protein [Xyrichtys novacula]